jgi:hypothetical protein
VRFCWRTLRLSQAIRTQTKTQMHRSCQLMAAMQDPKPSLLRSLHDDGAQSAARFPQARTIVLAIGSMMLFAPVRTLAADLKPETVRKWEGYVKAVSARNQGRLVSGSSFLSIDETPDGAARLRGGEIVVSPAGPHVPMKIPSGLIHDWVGDAFVPSVTLPDVLRVVRDYSRYQDIYHPNVLDSKPTATGEWEDRFSLVLMNKSIVRTALDSDYRSSYTRLDDRRWYSTTETTRIQEVADYGASSQHTLPENQGAGLIWRLYNVARFEERDGGVYVEVEAVALSRDIPVSLRWLVDPIVRRISRSSLATSLQQTQDALRSGLSSASRYSSGPLCSARKNCVVDVHPSDTRPVHSFR